MKLFKRLATGLLLAGLSIVPAQAQIDQGKVSGNVRDQTAAFVPDVTVTVTNERTGEVRRGTTNGQGLFFIGNLRPSSYTIRVDKEGFSPIEYTNIALALGQELNLDFEFKPAGIAEELTVVADAPVLDVSSARVGVNVSEREVEGLPVNGRQMSQLLLQAPGSQNAGTGSWQDIRFSGRAVEQNAVRYDGVEGSAVIDSAPGNINGEVASPFKLQTSLENVQEFRVESSSYPAEYGTGTGGQISVITKSGGNQFSGSVFEYFRDDGLDAPNYFDSTRDLAGNVTQELPKSVLRQHQFGVSFGGPIASNRAFFFGSYEAYRLDAGVNWVEAVPSDAAWARAVPAVAALRQGFMSPNAVLLPGASTDPNFDIAQLQGLAATREDAFNGRLDFKFANNWSSYIRFSHDQGTNDSPEGVSGRVVKLTANPTNAVVNLQGIFSATMINDFKFGYNGAPTTVIGDAPIVGGVDFNPIAINLSGSVANTGIAGQGSSSGIVVPGGLVRANSATNGHGQPYDPYSLTFADTVSNVMGSHYLKVGGEFRAIRMETDRIGGTTYTYADVNNFMANRPQSVQYLGDVSEPSVFNNGATGPRHTIQNYTILFAQDEWRVRPDLTFNYGLRYEYYTPMRERDNLQVKWNVDTGVIDPNTTPLFESSKDNFQPRASVSWSANQRTILKVGAGIFVGPGQTEDQIQPIESDRISSTLTSGVAYPIDPALLRQSFINNPNTRSYQPRAYANEYNIPERIYQYTASVQRDLGRNLVASATYVGSQGRNLFLRSVANNIVGVFNPTPGGNALVVREFSIVTARDANGNPTAVQNPYAEVDYKTSGGRDNYNAIQLALTRRSALGLTMNAQYTLGRSRGNTGGSNEALTAGNAARTLEDFDYDNGYNNFDVRHTFNFSAVYALPFGRNTTGAAKVFADGWEIGGIANARSGLPIDVRIVRPDIVYVDGAGNIFQNAAAGRIGIINTPRGGSSRNVRRPDLVAGVDPFIRDGGLLFLNPAAFSTPTPGTFGNLERNSLHGPAFRQFDLLIMKRFALGGRSDKNIEFRTEIFNLFNIANFASPVGTIPIALPLNSLTEANRLQPGEPYTPTAAGAFGRITSTVGRTVGLGTSRQVQFALRLNF
ncbi:MAG TPA: TonB-dependent receptor [Vicinamibacterales bacterium]|nr:TonB-dependent receptor [Vicinamibacterales bacterium]